jgi:hypothetical protein
MLSMTARHKKRLAADDAVGSSDRDGRLHRAFQNSLMR